MQCEMAHPSCPLCKRQLSGNSLEHTLSTRLCEQCQTMVVTAFRGADSIPAASSVVVSQNGGPPHIQREDHTRVASPAFFEGAPTDGPFESELQSSIPFEAQDRARFNFYEDDDANDEIHTVEPDSFSFSGNGSSPHYDEVCEGSAQLVNTPDADYDGADESHLAGQNSEFAESVAGLAHSGASPFEDRSGYPPSIAEEVVTDPWEIPLPAWEYSHNEWPILVGPGERRPTGRLRPAIAAVVLLAGAGGLYFLISRPSTPVRNAATDSGTTARVATVEPRAAAGRPSDKDPAAELSAPAETAARETVLSNDNSAKGRFSLQAAAFPTQDGADEFAEKLKRAGVPSYVVPADIARRGRWFRVRVGRFNAADDAQSFAGEAQQRARSAGLTLQLIVCQYEQP